MNEKKKENQNQKKRTRDRLWFVFKFLTLQLCLLFGWKTDYYYGFCNVIFNYSPRKKRKEKNFDYYAYSLTLGLLIAQPASPPTWAFEVSFLQYYHHPTFCKKEKKSVFIFFCQPVALPSMYVHSRENIRKNPPQDNICNGERLALIVFLPVLSAPTTRRFSDSAD